MRDSFDIVVWCEKTGAMDFIARMYDRQTQTFYSGSASTPLEAVAWLFDDYIARVYYGAGPSVARDGASTPGSRFGSLGAGKASLEAWASDARPVHGSNPTAPTTNAAIVANFDQRIPRTAEPALFGQVKKEAAARRAATKKKAKST